MTIPLTADQTEEYRPPSLTDHPDIVFYLRTPTWRDRDTLQTRMFASGVATVTEQAVRAIIIEELYETTYRDDEEAGDVAAAFLEDLWGRQQEDQLAFNNWQIQEAQRVADTIEAGRELQPMAEKPKPLISPRERARAVSMIDAVQDASQRLRDKMVLQTTENDRYGTMLARMSIAGWAGLAIECGIDARGIMEEETMEALRTELYPLAPAAWGELRLAAAQTYNLPQAEVGNSDSPPGNTSATNGSRGPSGGSVRKGGTSTKPPKALRSVTGPRRSGGSRITTATSSESTRASAPKTATRGRTAAPSSTSPSA